MAYLADAVVVGGSEGNSFEFNGITNGATLEQIWVWVGKNQVRGIKVELADGRSMQFGKADGNVTKFRFEDGEHFTSLSLWESVKQEKNFLGFKKHQDGIKCLGGIKFKTNHSREFFADTQNQDSKTEVSVDVASGICIGIQGCSEEKINCLGFMFFTIIKSTEITDIEYPTLRDVIPKVATREIKSVTYHNNTSEPQEYTLETSKKITQTSSWSVTGKLESTFSLNVKAGIPNIVEGQAGYGLTRGVEGTYPKETTEERMEHFSFPVKVPAGKTVDVDITVGEVKIDLPFNGVVKISCHSGGVLQIKTSGTYKGLTYTSGNVVVNESDKKLVRASKASK